MRLLSVLLLTGLVAGSVPAGPEPAIHRDTSGAVRVGLVQVLAHEAAMECPAVVNQTEGALEYVLVGEGGKTHESLLRTPVQALSLQLALLLLSAEGRALELEVRWQRDGRSGTARIEEWILDARSGKAMGSGGWRFTPTPAEAVEELGQPGRSLVAIHRDPSALVGATLPGSELDEIWSAGGAELPPVGTAVTLVIRVVQPQGTDQVEEPEK